MVSASADEALKAVVIHSERMAQGMARVATLCNIECEGVTLAAIVEPAVRLVLVRGGLFGTSNGQRRFASQLEPGFALCPAERAASLM